MDPRPHRDRPHAARRLLLMAAAAACLLAACGSTAHQLSSVGAAIPAASAAPASNRAAAAEVPATEDGMALPEAGSSTVDRLIVRTGQLALRVTDLDAAVAAVARRVEALGGYVAASERSGEDQGATARITYRVPADRWEDALAAARAAADEVLAEQTSSAEVTDQVVDLGARLVNLRATETALREIMARATKIPDILEVQGQLTSVREQIERLEADRQRLEGQAAMATLVTDFSLPPLVAVATVQAGWDPAAEVDRAAAALVEMTQGAVNLGIWLLVVWLPVLLVAGAVALVAFLVVRRARRRPPLVPPAVPPEPGPDLPAPAAG